MSNTRLVRRADRRQVPWKNGAGMTEEIAVDGDRWRISVADLDDSASTFSAFDGKHRVFTVIGPHGVRLEFGDGDALLEPFHPHPFDGANAPRCVPFGRTSAFNVMTDKRTAAPRVTAVHLDSAGLRTDSDVVTVAYVSSGSATAADVEADAGDCIVVDHDTVHIVGSADILLVEIRTIAVS